MLLTIFAGVIFLRGTVTGGRTNLWFFSQYNKEYFWHLSGEVSLWKMKMPQFGGPNQPTIRGDYLFVESSIYINFCLFISLQVNT